MSTRTRKPRNRVVRRDPPTRAPDGHQPWGRIKNPLPGYHYVAVDPGNSFHGVALYEAYGYEQVLRTEGGERFVMDGKGDNGSVIAQHHQILMRIPLGDPRDPQPGTKAFLDAPGQAEADAMEQRIIQKRGAVDGLRGIDRDISLVNETSRSFVERRVG